jgi:DNA-directed RNA polymerase subunit RPC12/RpoP
MRQILDTLGITMEEFTRRSETQKDEMRKMAIEKLWKAEQMRRQAKDEQSTCKYCGMQVTPGKLCGRTQCIERRKREDREPAKDTRRARLHRALDCVMDRRAAKDTRGHNCDACGVHLPEDAFAASGSWSYKCPRCGFKYNHNGPSIGDQLLAQKKISQREYDRDY